MPSKPQQKHPATPAAGSSPIRPPNGSTPGGKKQQTRPVPATRPTQPLSPLAQALMQKKLQAMQRQPLFAPPTKPAGVAAMTPAGAPLDRGAQADAARLQGLADAARQHQLPAMPPQTPEWLRGTQQQFLNVAPPPADTTPGPNYNPQGVFAPGGGFERDVAYPVVKRLNEAYNAINAPTYENVPPPAGSGAVSNLTNASGRPAVAGTRLNEDGTEDWAIPGRNGVIEFTPKTKINQPNLLQRSGRATWQGLSIGLEALGLPAKGIERGIGSLVQNGNGGAEILTPVILPNGQTYTPPQNFTPGAGQQFNPDGTPITTRWQGQQAIANMPGVSQVARQLYGDTPEVQQALADVTRIAYSPGEAQLRAVARMVEYKQLPDAALYGDGGYVNDHLIELGYLDDPIKAIKADPLANYVYGTMRQTGMTDEEIVTAFNTEGLRGEQYMPTEVLGQVILDPLNFVGEITKPLLEAERVARAAKVFNTPTVRTAEEIAASMRGGMAPIETGLGLVDNVANFFLGKTPSAVRSQLVQSGGDALSLALTAAEDGTAAGVKGGRYNLLKALYDVAETAPARLPGQTEEAFNLATQAWRSSQQTAQAILQQYPAAMSEAGKLGGGLVRKLLQGQDGQLSTKLLTEIASSGKPAYQIMADLMTKLDDAATSLLLPERAGARTAAEFVANTGRTAQEFPIFERSFAGAGERVAVEKSIQAAADRALELRQPATGLTYKAGNWAHLVDGFNSVRNRVNSGLWKVFAQASPSYSARNALNNMFTALADGNLTFDDAGKVEEFLHLIGDPSAAVKGIGAGEVTAKGANKLAGGFAGNMRTTDLPLVGNALKRLGVDVPLGAQAVEEAFSKRIVYTAAKRYLDRMMTLGKAIPDLPPSLMASLGDDVVNQVVQHLATTYGDTAGALEMVQKLRGGAAELWRIPAAEHMDAVREFGGTLDQRVSDLLNSHQTPEELRAGMAQIRREVAQQLQVADNAIPSLTAMTGEVGESHAADLKMLQDLDIDADRIAGASPESFAQRLASDQNRVSTAQGTAFEALKRNPDPAAFDSFAQVQQRVTEGGRKTSEAVTALREAAWDKTKAYRSMAGLSPDQRGRFIDEVWRDYFARRDQLWTSYRTRAIGLWDEISAKAGVSFAPIEGATDDAAGLVQHYTAAEKRALERRAETDWLAQQGAQFPPGSPEAAQWEIRANEFAADQKAYWRQYGHQGVLPEVAPVADALPGVVDDIPAMPEATGNLNAPELAGTPMQPQMQIPGKWTPADPRSILSTLNSVEAQALQKFGTTRPVNLSDEQFQLLQDWLQAVSGQTQEAKAIAGQAGSEARNFALLNYADKRNIDVGLGVTHPYHYWYGRTYANWMQRAVQNPAMMANYGRYRGALDTMHAALPEYWRQQLSTDDLGLDMETPLMFNLEQTLSPLYGLLGSDYTDPNRRRAGPMIGGQNLGAWTEDAGSLGPTPWAPIAWASALSSYMGGDKDAGNAWMQNYLGTLPRAVRALTAQAGIGPAGGVNLDPQMFVANLMSGNGPALNSMTPWERSRVATTLDGYFDNIPAGVDPADWKAQVEEASYTQSGPLWDKAMQEMFVGTAPAVLTSYLAGLGFKGRSETEAEVGRVYAEMNAIQANRANMTVEEMAQAYLDLQRRNPISELLQLSKTAGPARDDAWIWEAMGRVGIGERGKWQDAGVSETALDAFFKTKTTEGMDPDLLKELLTGANTINARNRPVSLEEQQQQLDARNSYNDIQEKLHKTFDGTGAYELQDEFYRIRDEQGNDVANTWMDSLEPARQGLLRGLLDARTEAMMAAGPDVQRYYIDPERYEAMLVGQYYEQAEADRPGIRDLSDQYWQLRDARDFGPADLLLKEHPELKEYWDETSAFKSGVHGQVMDWLDNLHQQVPTTQGQERADFDPRGFTQDALDKSYKADADAQLGIYDSPYGQDSQGGGGGAPTTATGGATTLADQYRAKYDAEQAAKLAETEGRQTYLTPKSKLAYGDADIQPLLDQWGPELTAQYFDQPIAEQWPTAPTGVKGLLAMLGEAESVREGLLNFATESKTADWSKFVGLLRNMSDEELAAIARRYPQLADARTVAEQAREYDQPTISALHDILGFNVTFTEAGNYSINGQSVKKNKKTGEYDPTVLGGGSTGGGFSAGSTPRSTYARMGGRAGGGGGGGSADSGQDTGPDEVAEQIGSWITFATKLKADQPEMLTLLMDFLDAPDDLARNDFLKRYPEIMQLLQSLGAEKLAQLAEAYYSWRQDQQDAQAPVGKNGKKQLGPQIIRYYSKRPSTTGLQ